MLSIQIIQIMAILYFIAAVKMKVWKVSLNTFVVLTAVFVVTISREFDFAQHIWIDYHLGIIGFTMTFLMVRVVYQSINKKLVDSICDNCIDFKRRKGDTV